MSAILVSSGSSVSGSSAPSSSHSSSSVVPDTQAIMRLGVTQNTTPSTSTLSASNARFPVPPLIQVAEDDEIDRWDGDYQDIWYPPECLSAISLVELDLAKTLLGPNVEVRSLANLNICYPLEGYIGLHFTSICFGLRLPIHRFLSNICRYHTIVPTQLTPNAHRLLSCFLTLCDAFGLVPSLSLFHHCFQLTRTPKSNRGHVLLSQRGVFKILDGLDSSLKNLKDQFLFSRHAAIPFSFWDTLGRYFFRLHGPASASRPRGGTFWLPAGCSG